MKPMGLSRRLPFLVLILAIGLGAVLGDEDGTEEDGDNTEVTVDTCGRLNGRLVTFTTSSTSHPTARVYVNYEMEYSIEMEVLTRNEGSVDTNRIPLLSWSEYETTDGYDSPTGPVVKARKDSL